MRITPSNQLLDMKWKYYLHKKHLERLMRIKGIIDQSPPHSLIHLAELTKWKQLNKG